MFTCPKPLYLFRMETAPPRPSQQIHILCTAWLSNLNIPTKKPPETASCAHFSCHTPSSLSPPVLIKVPHIFGSLQTLWGPGIRGERPGLVLPKSKWQASMTGMKGLKGRDTFLMSPAAAPRAVHPDHGLCRAQIPGRQSWVTRAGCRTGISSFS